MLSAFLDGTATEEERADIMRAIAEDRAEYARFVEALRIRAALEAPPADVATPALDEAGITPARRLEVMRAEPVRRAAVSADRNAPSGSALRARRLLAPLLLAASLITVVLLTRNATRRTAAGTAVDMIAVAELVSVPSVRGNGAVDQALRGGAADPAWSVTRGADDGRAVSARAFRAGVRVAQLEIAAAAEDSTATAHATVSLQTLLRDVDGAAPLSVTLGSVTSSGALPDRNARHAISRQVRSLTGAAPWFDLGVWTESARHAAHRPQPAFFAPGSLPMNGARRLLTGTAGNSDWEIATQPLRTFVQQPPEQASMDAVLQILDAVALSAGG